MINNATVRRLALDVPLALLAGGLATGSGHSAAYWSQRPGPVGGPPWTQGGPPWTDQPPPSALGEPYGWSMLAWVLILMLGVAFRRVRPITGYALTVVGTTGYLSVGLPFGPVLIGPALGLLALATRMSVRRWAPWAVLLVPMLWAGYIREPYVGLTDPGLPGALVLGGAAVITPSLIAAIRRTRHQAQHRAHELDLRRAAYQERLKIARDVHDVIGHSLSVINMQAGVALYLLQKRAAEAPTGDQDKITESVTAIRSTSKSALDELRATLAVFRGEDGDQRAPVAGLERVPELAEAFRTAGREVKLIMDRQTPVPGPVDIAAYRIIQEALTNIARHTTSAAATIRVSSDPEKLIIDVTDDGPPVPSDRQADRQVGGNGLIGMAERAEAVGGSVRTGPLPEGGFGVHAEFPIKLSGSES